MEGCSDKSSSLSVDSGELIDLSALDSDGKTGETSPDKSKEAGVDKKRQRQSSGEAWLLDMDAKMKDMKLIEEEEFDFDIPDDYLNISMEPEQLSSVEDSLSSDVSSPEANGLLVEVGGEERGSQEGRDQDKRIYNGAEKEDIVFENLAPLCAAPGGNPCNHETVSGLTDPGISQVRPVKDADQNSSSAGVLELLPMGCCDTTRVLTASKRDLIAFTPAPQDWANFQEDGASVTRKICGEFESARVNCRTTSPIVYTCQEQSGQLEQPEVSGQMVEEQSGQSQVSEQAVEEQASRSHEGECGGNTSGGELQKRSSDAAVHLNRSRLPTPSEQLKNCSTFSRSPVKCSQLEELREATKQLTNHSLPHHCSSEAPLLYNANETASIPSLLPNPSDTQQSSSCETFIIPTNSSNASSPTAEIQTENLDDSRSSCLSQVSQASSTSSTTSRSRDSYGGGGSKLPRKSVGGGRGIPAPSKSKLVKPGTSKPSLLPSTSIPMGTKLKRLSEKPPTRLSMLPRDSQSSQSSLKLRLPSAGGGSGTSGTNTTNTTRSIPRPSATNDKGSRKSNPIRATHLAKPSMLPAKSLQHNGNNIPNSKMTQQRQSAAALEGVPKSKLASPGPRRKSTYTMAAKPKSSSTSAALSLSTSLVSTGSPSVQQSTPLKQGEKVVDCTPKRRSTADRVRPTFSLSSIEGSVTPKPPPSALCPRSNETYVVGGEGGGGEGGGGGGGGGEEGNVAKTPKSTKKGRRSLIPTPKGQERGYGQENASPIPFNFSEGGGEDRSRKSTNMPPPKTKKLLNPRARPSGLQRPLQRGGGTRVLGVRPNGCKRTEGPMKPRRTFTFGGHDEETEVPFPRARVVHSPIDKENLPATPHSKWSPIRKKKYLTVEEECIQCTKRSVK